MSIHTTSTGAIGEESPRPDNSQKQLNWATEASSIVLGPRRAAYGHPIHNFSRLSALWTPMILVMIQEKGYISPVDVAHLFTVSKEVRELNEHKDDNPIDSIGYLLCHEAIDTYMREDGFPDGAEAFRGMTFDQFIAFFAHLTTKNP